jgi:hypothetical protein
MRSETQCNSLAVAADVALALPTGLLALTTTRRVAPRSALDGV